MDKQSAPLPHRTARYVRLSLLLAILFYAALMLAGGSRLTAAFNIPRESADQAMAYVAKYGWSIQLGSFYKLVSAIPLAIFMMATIGRVRFLGGRAAEEMIALLGGIGTPLMLLFSALSSWSLTRPGVAEATGAVRALQAFDFGAAGPGFAVLLGFFIGGISLAAGPCNAIPRWLMWSGILLAIACEMAALTLLNFKAGYFIPVGRFVSIAWMIGIALTLPSAIGGQEYHTRTASLKMCS